MTDKQQRGITRLVELDNELRHLVREHDTLKCQLSLLRLIENCKNA